MELDPAPSMSVDGDTALRRRLESAELRELMEEARQKRDARHGMIRTYSPKVFIPLTRLCRDVCHYCTFARPARPGQAAYLNEEEILRIARAGVEAGCTEALFTLGEKPELRHRSARDALAARGHATTIAYLAEMAEIVVRETGLLPHVNPGTLSREEMLQLRRISVSQGMMLESTSTRLCGPGGPHYGSPDKHPTVRLETIRLAGELRVPFTSGLLIGIGETRSERLDALFALRDLDRRYGHIQEIIIQNFRAKPLTAMSAAVEPSLDELLWTIAAARLIQGAHMNIQAPPNLTAVDYHRLLEAGINDWGGISPVTMDHVNPEAAWPSISELSRRTEHSGATLVPRLPLYPSFVLDLPRWVDPALEGRVMAVMDGAGYARGERWTPGAVHRPPDHRPAGGRPQVSAVGSFVDRARRGETLEASEIAVLFSARGNEFHLICRAADELRHDINGDAISYVVTRNINYTNVCGYHCRFCAFSKGTRHEHLRGPAYDLDLDEVARRVAEAWQRGATEVCMQGGIHPGYTGDTYLSLCRTAKSAAPSIHIHAFSPLEIRHGAATLGISIHAFLLELRRAGLASLPGTAAEILDERVRAELCPDKLSGSEWTEVIEAAHAVGLRTTSTIMFGHIDRYEHWAHHLLALRAIQSRTGGLTEFVPLPFVPMEAPLFLRGRSRKGPTFRESVLMHAVGRLVLHPHVANVQVSWPKMGIEGAKICLQSGANDFGGTLMNESITRAAGGAHGQEFAPDAMEAAIRSLGRVPVMRSTLYTSVSPERRESAAGAAALAPLALSLLGRPIPFRRASRRAPTEREPPVPSAAGHP
jgi:FO synthase